jgi:hypothetical protein
VRPQWAVSVVHSDWFSETGDSQTPRPEEKNRMNSHKHARFTHARWLEMVLPMMLSGQSFADACAELPCATHACYGWSPN